MATLTRAQMVTKTLQRLGVLGVDQSASASDADIVGPILDALHDELRTYGLAPYATSAFPMWSQELFAQMLAGRAGPYFGQPGGDNPSVWRAYRSQAGPSGKRQAAKVRAF